MIYLDYAASTPMSPSSLHVFSEVSTKFYANSSSLHDCAGDVQTLLEECRTQLARNLNGAPQGIYFTSGGSESNHLCLVSLARAYVKKGDHLITTATEHPSITNTFRLLEKEGFKVTELQVDRSVKSEGR